MSSKVKAPKQFTIKRSKWSRGKSNPGDPYRSLLDSNGKMCCLGFFSKACGLTNDQILDVDTPEELTMDTPARNMLSRKAPWLFNELTGDTADCHFLVSTNDKTVLTNKKREFLVAKKFKEHGIKVRFVD